MASVPYKFATLGSTNLQVVRAGQTANLKGIVAVNAAAYEVFVKLYWFAPGEVTAGTDSPTVGTTVPELTFAVPALGTTTGGLNVSFPDGITEVGNLWVAVTKLGTDADATAVLANDAVVTLLVE
jgi:hypothetical protein